MDRILRLKLGKYALNTYYVTGTVLGPEDTIVNKTETSLPT